MRERLCYLLPDVKHAKSAMRHLLLARIEERHIHVLAKDGIDIGDLPVATLGQKSDFYHAMALGIVVGGTTGLVGGFSAFYFAAESMKVGFDGIAMLALLGSVFGVWISGLIGTDVPNTRLKKFSKDIEKGKLLMMIDVPLRRAGEVKAIMHKQHPEASQRGIDSMYPVFP